MKKFVSVSCLLSLAFSAAGCALSVSASSTPAAEEEPAQEKKSEPVAEKEKEAPAPQLVHSLADAGFQSPDSVIYDPEADVYLVSNVNGPSLAEDGNGFISQVTPDGEVKELRWIDGLKSGTTLNAPKGMALSGPYLYVSDITWVRIFDRKTGEPRGKVRTQASYLNDVETLENGEVVFSDTGWKAGNEGYESTGTQALFRIDPKTVAAAEVAKSEELGNPNGLAATKDGLWVVNDQGELYRVGDGGKKEQTTKLAKGGLDGVVALDDGSFLVSSWEGGAIYQGKPGEEFRVLLAEQAGSASIGIDTKRHRLLVPKMIESKVLVYQLPAGQEAATSEKAADEESAAPDSSAAATAPVAKKDPPAAKKPLPAKKAAASKASAKKPAAPAAAMKAPAPKATAKKPTPSKKAPPASAEKKAPPAATGKKAADPVPEKNSATPAPEKKPAQPVTPPAPGSGRGR